MTRTPSLLCRLRRRLGTESGFALVLSLSTLATLSIAGMTIVGYSTAGTRSSGVSAAKQGSYSLAEAGINDAMAVLSKPENNALDDKLFCDQQQQPPCTRTTSYDGGTVRWTGTLNKSTGVWHLTSTGYRRNPTGPTAADAEWTLSADVSIVAAQTAPLNNMAWNYIFVTRTGDPDGCDESLDNTVNMATPMYVNGNLCLNTPSTITGGPLVVKGKVELDVNTNIGTALAPINEAHVAGGCQYKNQPLDLLCGGADKVWAKTTDTVIPAATAPVADFDGWYAKASPGPKFPCDPTRSSGITPIFETTNDTLRNNSVPGVWNLTPSASYDCWTALGELKWDAPNKLLTVGGTIYIDGSAKIDNGAVNSYNGQATLYLSGTFQVSNSKLCAGLTADKTDCDFPSWNPNTEMLVVVADGDGGQNPIGDSIQIKSSRYQGALYASKQIELDTTSRTEGPMIADTVILGQSVQTYGFPLITTVPSGMPGLLNVYAQPNPPTNYSS